MAKKARDFMEISLLMLEIHFFKIMMVAFFFLGTREVHLLHLGYIIIAVVGVKSRTEVQVLLTRVASLISAILLITNMIYQVEYIEHDNYKANCTNQNESTEDVVAVDNNAEWVGFNKAKGDITLTHLIKPYLYYIVLVCVHAVIVLRQTIKRIKLGKSPQTPSVVFKKIKRSDADKDIPHLLKYLVNYGFYKFGIEV